MRNCSTVLRKHVAFFLALAMILSLMPISPTMTALATEVHTFVGDGFTVTTTVHSSWATGHNIMFEVTNTGNEDWPHWVFSANRPLGLNVPTQWGESWQNNGLFVHQDDSETAIRNLGHQAPVRPGESVQIHTYSNTQPFFMPTDFRVRPAERRLVPLADRDVQVLQHSEWLGTNFHHAVVVQNISNRIIQNWEMHLGTVQK